MTEKSWPFWAPAAGNTFGKTMSEDQWAEMFRYVMNTGVMAVNFQDMLNELIVTPGNLANTINVDTGAAWIQGHIYINDSINTLGPIIPPVSGTRADLIVLELKWGLDAGITAKIIPGTTNAIWPVGDPRTPNWMPPQPVTTYGVRWQLPLAQVNVASGHATPFAQTDIVDWRAFTNAGSAKSSTYVVAAAGANPTIRANADAVIPYGSLNADWVINQAIINVAAYGGGTVLLSEGVFTTSDTINLLANVNLKGLGTNTKIQFTPSGSAAPVITAAAQSNIQVSDMTIDGGGGSTTVPVAGAGTWSDVGVNTGWDGIFVNEGTSVEIKDCVITHCKGSGVYLRTADSSGTASYGWKITDCVISENYYCGIATSGNAGIYARNQVRHCGYGIILGDNPGGTWGASFNEINSNIVAENMKTGILLTATTNCIHNTVSNNNVFDNSRNVTNIDANILLSGAPCQNNIIVGNNLSTGGSQTTLYGVRLTNGCSNNSALANHLIGAAATYQNDYVDDSGQTNYTYGNVT